MRNKMSKKCLYEEFDKILVELGNRYKYTDMSRENFECVLSDFKNTIDIFRDDLLKRVCNK